MNIKDETFEIEKKNKFKKVRNVYIFFVVIYERNVILFYL
jgi:hypothetical protein